jgi:hypothetical protein
MNSYRVLIRYLKGRYLLEDLGDDIRMVKIKLSLCLTN